MFQTEIKFITDFTLNNVKKLGSFFTFERLLETNIHPAIKQYINAEFEFLIYEDRQKLIQGSLFDYSGPKIHHHFSIIAEEIKKTKKVSYEDMKILISRAVSFNVSYVLKPNWSLQKLIFGEKKNISLGELELVLNYLYYYDYLKNVFKAYLSKRNIINVSSTEFELILNKIDRELFTSHFEKLVDNSLISIADLFSIGGVNKKNISVEAVEIFLKEKNLIDHLLRLKRTIPAPGKRKYDIDDIRRIIYSATPVEPTSIVPTADESDTETEGDFQKVKTLEEAEIKQLTQSDEILEEEPKSDENIIHELIQDEIVKQDIEELIEETQPEQKPDEESMELTTDIDQEILDQESKKHHKKKKKTKHHNRDEDKKEEIISPPVADDDSKQTNEEISESQEENDEEVSLELIIEGDDNIIEETELLSDKDEEELFSFYEDELKEVDENTSDEEEIIDSEEIGTQLSVDENDSPSLEDDESINQVKIEEENNEPNFDLEEEIIEIEKNSEEALPSTKLKRKRDIFSFLSSKEIDRITDSVFNSDSEDFANTIERISECENYNDATEILKSLFISSKISPQSKQAVLLTNAVANYFDQV